MPQKLATTKEGVRFGWYIASAIVIIIIPLLMMKLGLFGREELYIGMLIVVAISILMVLLFIMTAAFARLGLADPTQALGLPQGSVRSMIALILLLVFIIVGIYVFRTVAGLPSATLRGLTATEVAQLGETVFWARENESGTYDVTLRGVVTDDGSRLAQQLMTTIGTLVVAVAGFYFGTSAISTAHSVVAPSIPLIRSIKPTEGKQGDEFADVEILGKNFETVKMVKLIHNSEEIILEDLLSSVTKIRCKLKIPPSQQPGMYELLVLSASGSEDRLPDAFDVKNSDLTQR